MRPVTLFIKIKNYKNVKEFRQYKSKSTQHQ